MGRWADRRANKRTENYLGDYGRAPDMPSAPNPYETNLPAPDASPSAAQHNPSSPPRGSSRGPTWATGPDPGAANRADRDYRREAAGWPSGSQVRQGGYPNAQRKTLSNGLIGTLVTVAVILLVVVGAVGLLATDGGTTGPRPTSPTGPTGPSGPPAPQEEALDPHWELRARELLTVGQDTYAVFVPLNSRERFDFQVSSMLTTQDVWVVAVTAADEPQRRLVALDAATGDELWSIDAEAQCATTLSSEETLWCVEPDDGELRGFELDVSSGEELSSWSAAIESTWSVYLTESGLVVNAGDDKTFTDLILLDLADGSSLWEIDVTGLENSDYILRETESEDGTRYTAVARPTWNLMDENLILRTGIAVTFIDVEGGSVSEQMCYPSVVTSEFVGCSSSMRSDNGLYESDGSELWVSHTDNFELAYTGYRGQEVAINIAGEQVRPTDWETGEIGDPILDVGAYAIATGTSDYPFVVEEEEGVHLLSADQSEARWSLELQEPSSITTVLIVDDIAVINSVPTLGVDLDTGEVLWQHDAFMTLDVINEGLVSVSATTIASLKTP